MNEGKLRKMARLAALGAVASAGTLLAAISQNDSVVISSGTIDCAGSYNAFAEMTNSSGSTWLVPPNGTHTGTFTNASGFPAPFAATLIVTRKSDGLKWCGTNSLVFSATNSSYKLSAYITSTLPPPTNNQPMNLMVIWQ